MKKNRFYVFALFVLLCLIVIICVCRRGSSFMISEMIPENITRIEVSGSQNGGELEPWELDQEEIEELTEWLSELSLMHKTYSEGKSPNIIWNGGVSYELISTMVNYPSLGYTLIKPISIMMMSGIKS